MLKQSKKDHRQNPTINAGSMADIAFLLLIFFLVSTQLYQEKAIKVVLPPWSEATVKGQTTKAILNIKINESGEILIDKAISNIDDLKEKTKSFIRHPISAFGKLKATNQSVISLQHDAKTSYGKYLRVYDEIQKAYNEIHTEEARSIYKKEWDKLQIIERNEIRKKFPVCISEAEPFTS